MASGVVRAKWTIPVMAVTAYVWEEGVGAVFTRDAVLITADGADVMSAAPAYGEAVHG